MAFMYNKLFFNEINFLQLTTGKKYYIKINIGNNTIERDGIFIKYEDDSYSALFGNITYNYKSFGIGKIYLNNDDYFYDISYQKYKIQNAMEIRAINQILRKITGDETFNY